MPPTGAPQATKYILADAFDWRTARIGAWLCVLALAVLSLIPRDWILRSDNLFEIQPIPVAEHGLAYLLTGLVVAVGYGAQYRSPQLILTLVGYAAVLELGQNLAPGRGPGLGEFGGGALGAMLGVLIGEKIRAWRRTRTLPA